MWDLGFVLEQASWVCRGHTAFQSVHDNLLVPVGGNRWHLWGDGPPPPPPFPGWSREALLEEGCL